MQFDPNNPVVLLCVQGMTVEGEGNIAEAQSLFQQAWDIASNDFEAFTAAHYLARNQPDLHEGLKWNLEALSRADRIPDETMKQHYPSLHLNVAKSYETLEDMPNAVIYYQKAAESSEYLPPGRYAEMIRGGIAAGLKRTGHINPEDQQIELLINAWCERKELRPLSMVLPAYVGNLGTLVDRDKLLSAFSYLSATRCLEEKEQEIVESIIKSLSPE